MGLINLNFEDDAEEEVTTTAPESEQPATIPPIALSFEGEEHLDEPLPQGVTGEARPVERSVFEWISDAYMEGYTATKQSIAAQKGLIFDETLEDQISTGVRLKELERQREGYGASRDTMQELREISEADSITEAVGLMIKYPAATAQVTISSLGRFAPALAATIGVGAASGGTAIPVMTSSFMGSLSVEYGAVMDETIRESGYDASDPMSWVNAVQDQELLDRARNRGIKRGLPIAVFDAISMGLAGKLLAGAKPTATSILSRSTGEMAQQSIMGGAGEAAAQYVETGEMGQPGEVALEGFAEMGPGMVETLIGYKGAKQQALRKQMAEQAGYEASQREADQKLTPDFEVKSVEENATAIDEALAATPPTPEVRPDEDSITEKFDLEKEAEAAQPEPPMDKEQLQAEAEANAIVLEQLRQQFPDASEEELLAAIEVSKPETLPTEEDLGYSEPEQPTSVLSEVAEEIEKEKPKVKPEEEKRATFAETAATMSTSTVDVVAEAIEAVGEAEFERQVDAELARDGKDRGDKQTTIDASDIEGVARNIVAINRRKAATQPSPEELVEGLSDDVLISVAEHGDMVSVPMSIIHRPEDKEILRKAGLSRTETSDTGTEYEAVPVEQLYAERDRRSKSKRPAEELDELESYRDKARSDFEKHGVSDRDRMTKVEALRKNVSQEAADAYDSTYADLVDKAVAERVASQAEAEQKQSPLHAPATTAAGEPIINEQTGEQESKGHTQLVKLTREFNANEKVGKKQPALENLMSTHWGFGDTFEQAQTTIRVALREGRQDIVDQAIYKAEMFVEQGKITSDNLDQLRAQASPATQPTPEELEVKAGEAATSPDNDLPLPSDAQIEAGNYKKGHVRYEGLDISVENPAGSIRRKEWAPLAHHYGDIKLSEGADGDAVDVFINKDNDPDVDTPVFPINQINQQTGKYDETKIMLGFNTLEEAKQAYRDNYPEGWKLPKIVPEFSIGELKDWLQYGDTTTSWDAPATAESPAQREEAKKAAKRREAAQKEYKSRLFPDEDTDDLITYIRKLGGIDTDFETDLKGRLSHLDKINNIFGLGPIERTGGAGLTLDRLGEALIAAGYLKPDPNIGNGVDSAALMELLFEAEAEPVYTPKGIENRLQAEQEAEIEEEQALLDNLSERAAEYVRDNPNEFSQTDEELARLMAQVALLDRDTMEDIAGRDIPDSDVKNLLQEFINERKGTETTPDAAEAATDETGEGDSGLAAEAETATETSVAEKRYPRKDAITSEPITDLTELSRYTEDDFSGIDPIIMGQAIDMVNLAIERMNEAGYTFEEVLHEPQSQLPDYLNEPMSDVTQAGSSLIPLSKVLRGIKKGYKRAKPDNVLDQLWRYTQALVTDTYYDWSSSAFKEHVQKNYPELASRLDEASGFVDEVGQGDLVGKSREERAQQEITDEKTKRDTTPDERPAEAQAGDDLFAQGGELESDLFAEPAAEEVAEFKVGDRVARKLGERVEPSMAGEVTNIDGPFVFVKFDDDPTVATPVPSIGLAMEPAVAAPETKGDQSNRLVEHITKADYPVGTEYIWSGFKAKVTGIEQPEEGRPSVLLEFIEGPLKGQTTTAPGHLKTLQRDLIPPFDIETTMGTVRLDVEWTMDLDKYQEIYEEKTVGIMSIQMHGPDDRGVTGSLRYRSIAGMPVRAETPEQLRDPEWIKDVATAAADGVLRRGEYFGEHVNMGKYKGGKARVVGRPPSIMAEVLDLSREPTADAKPLDKIKITVELGDEKVSHMAKWWVDAYDKRLEKVAKLRTCV